MVALEEKLGMDLRISHPSYCGLGRKPFFSGAVALSNVAEEFVKGCYSWTMRDMYGRGPYMD
jgi:hypothetical protein